MYKAKFFSVGMNLYMTKGQKIEKKNNKIKNKELKI